MNLLRYLFGGNNYVIVNADDLRRTLSAADSALQAKRRSAKQVARYLELRSRFFV